MKRSKILLAIEAEEALKSFLAYRTKKTNWENFTRTQFNLVALFINRQVTQRVIANPSLLKEFLLIGENKFQSIAFKYKINDPIEFVRFLVPEASNPFCWVSGKTLESFWSGGTPKSLKLNVLLAYLDIPMKDWEDWKFPEPIAQAVFAKEDLPLPVADFNPPFLESLDKTFYQNLQKYYLGSYYLYYLKTDNNQKIVKAPFVIKEENGQTVAESTTEGHRYKSHPIQKMINNLYISCINLDWSEEFEMHLFNIGLETRPEVIFGVSLTTTVKGGIPVALKNILIKQNSRTDFLKGETEVDFSLHAQDRNEEEGLVLKYFKKQTAQILFAEYCCSYQDFKEMMEGNE